MDALYCTSLSYVWHFRNQSYTSTRGIMYTLLLPPSPHAHTCCPCIGFTVELRRDYMIAWYLQENLTWCAHAATQALQDTLTARDMLNIFIRTAATSMCSYQTAKTLTTKVVKQLVFERRNSHEFSEPQPTISHTGTTSV